MGFWRDRRRLSRALDRAGVRHALRAEGDQLVVDLHPHPANLARAQAALAEWPALAAWLAATPRPAHVQVANVKLTAALCPQTDAERDEESALVAAMSANPDDDAPRLVYADRLIARGDPLGELIVLQCTPGRDAEERAERILARSWQTLAADVAPFAEHAITLRRFRFVRGFIERVYMTVDAFVEHGARVFGDYPTRTLEIIDSVPDCARLASSRALSRVPRLVMHPVWSVTLAPLAAGAFDRLEDLELHLYNASSDDRTADDFAWASTVRAPLLSRIDVSNRTTAFTSGFAANPNLPRLRHYREHVGYAEADQDFTSAYGALAHRHALESLHLSHSEGRAGDDALLPFFAPDTPSALRELSLMSTGVTDRFLREIARSPKLRLLEEFAFHEPAITAAGLAEVVTAATGLVSFRASSSDPEVAAVAASWHASRG
ncbi:MAG TPA: TIGR02996 domain-containing protein [Kofleriaceae bacterium]|nr:TIGR02996 domain-containing protein [Kofleriaceae bacterium]